MQYTPLYNAHPQNPKRGRSAKRNLVKLNPSFPYIATIVRKIPMKARTKQVIHPPSLINLYTTSPNFFIQFYWFVSFRIKVVKGLMSHLPKRPS